MWRSRSGTETLIGPHRLAPASVWTADKVEIATSPSRQRLKWSLSPHAALRPRTVLQDTVQRRSMKNSPWAGAGLPSERLTKFIGRPVWSRATRPRDGLRGMAARLVASSLVLAVMVFSSATALPGPQQTSPDRRDRKELQVRQRRQPSPRLSPCPTVPAPHGRKTLKTPPASPARHRRSAAPARRKSEAGRHRRRRDCDHHRLRCVEAGRRGPGARETETLTHHFDKRGCNRRSGRRSGIGSGTVERHSQQAAWQPIDHFAKGPYNRTDRP